MVKKRFHNIIKLLINTYCFKIIKAEIISKGCTNDNKYTF